MKQYFFTFLKMGLASVFLTILTFNSTKAQTTIFSENVGTPTGTTKLPLFFGWQNQGLLTFDSGQVTTSADVRSTSTSSTYSGASGGGNVYFLATAGSYGFSIEGINAATYSNLQLNFGYRKESASALPTFSVDFWNGSSWVTVANTSAALFNQTTTSAAGWYLAKTLSLPVGAQINDLKIRFVKSSTTPIRLDDIKLTGTPSAAISVSSATLASALTSTFGTASSVQTVTVTGSGLTANVVATSSSANVEVSSNGTSYGSTATFAPSSNAVNGTLYVRLTSSAAVGSYNSTNIILTSTNATNKTVSTRSSGNTVSPKSLTISGVSANNKAYDNTNTATLSGTPSLVGVVGSDVVSVSGTPTAAFAQSFIGNNVAVTVSGYSLSGTNAGNYIITQPSLSANITAKNLTISGIAIADKVVDGNSNAAILGTPTLQGVISGDSVFLSGNPFAQFTSTLVGSNIPVNVSGFTISGSENLNYSLTQPLGLSANIVNDSSELNINDIGLDFFEKPISSCHMGTNDSVVVWVRNVGSVNQINVPVAYTVNGGAPVTGTIPSVTGGSLVRYAFPTGANLAISGTYNFVVYTALANDGDRTNDTVRYNVTNSIINTFPHFQDFETSVSGNGSGIGTLPSGWSIDNFGRTGFPFSWQAFAGSTGSFNTGPRVDHTTGTVTGKYLYTEASYGTYNDSSFLYSPCLNMSALNLPTISFWYHKVGATMGDMIIEYDNNGTWTILDTILGQTHSTETDSWLKKTIFFPGRVSNTKIRFIGVKGSSFSGDMAIDDVQIFDSISSFPEISANQITFKKPNSCGLIADNMTVTIKNHSISAVSNLPIQIKINGVIDSLVLSNTILPLDSFNFNYSLSSKLVLGRNDILVFSSLSGDIDKTNDTLSITRMITNNDSFSLNLPDTIKSTNTSVTLNPGSANSFQWSTGETTPTITVNNSGKYSALAYNSAGCSSTDTTLVLFFRTAPRGIAANLSLINYQASLANPTGNPMSNQTIKIRFSIQDSLNTNYSEWQIVQTDSRGHIAVQVGNGNKIYGSLEGITWWDGQNRTLKTEIDTTGTGNWIVLGNSQLVSVPFALYALKSGDGSSSIYGSIDPNGNILTGNGFSVTPLGNGYYDIDFQQPFTEVPIFWVKSVGSGNYSEKIISVSPSKVSFQVTGSPNRIQFEAKGK